MGCDIHMFVEKKIDGEWVTAEGWVKQKDGTKRIPYPMSFYTGRDYDLFGLLAKVRGEHTFSLSPKGFPHDASKEVLEEYVDWGNDAHTPSYLTLKELKELEESLKTKKVKISGMKDETELKALKESLKSDNPDYDLLYPYCQATNAETHIPFTVEIPAEWLFRNFFRKVYWLGSYDYGCKDDEIRVVFWFDN